MRTRAVRLYGAEDARLEEFELPEIREDELLVKVMTDSICMSTYKMVKQGERHKRVPGNLAENSVILGHEFSGIIERVGKAWKDRYREGQRFALQPTLNYKGTLWAPGYSYPYYGGACTYCVIPHEAVEMNCILSYEGESFFEASLGEPYSCIIGGFHSNYHTNKQNYQHTMGIKAGGDLLILGGCGPMGLGAVGYALAMENGPARVVVTEIDEQRIKRAAELGNRLLAYDGCMNVFAGPVDTQFGATINLYDAHYGGAHIMGTSGGLSADMAEALLMIEKKLICPAVMVTHIGGLDSYADTVSRLTKIPGGKKLIYTQIDMPLTAISDFERLGKDQPLFRKLAESCRGHQGLWNSEAEKILLNTYGCREGERSA